MSFLFNLVIGILKLIWNIFFGICLFLFNLIILPLIDRGPKFVFILFVIFALLKWGLDILEQWGF